LKEEKKPKQKKKKEKKQALQIWTSGQEQQTDFVLFMNVAVRIALLCAAGAGTALFLVQLYKIPVNTSAVILWTVFVSLFFNILFIFLKFRYSLPLLALIFYFYQRVEDVLFNLRCVSDYLLNYIDGGMLSTAGYATRNSYEILLPSFYEPLQKGLILVCVIFALIFSLSARGKFIGSILITNIVILIPAIAAQKASYVPAMTLLAVSMMGLYSIWVSQEQSFLKSAKPRNLKTPPFIPRVHRHAVNGAAMAVIALVSALIAQTVLPPEKTHDIIDFFGGLADGMVEKTYEIGERFGGDFGLNFPTLNHGGYMPSGSIDASLSIDNPSIGRQRVLNVTLEDDNNFVYLRNGIGASFNPATGRWNVNSGANRMRSFDNRFYPEHEYLVFRQKAGQALGYDANALIGWQQVDVEYLVNAEHVMLPTSLSIPDYKSDPRFTWRNDAILMKRGSNRAEKYSWDVFYPIMSRELMSAINDVQNVIITQDVLTPANAISYNTEGIYEDYIHLTLDPGAGGRGDVPESGALRIFVEDYGLTAEQYLSMIYEYEKLIYEVYTETAPSESKNMQKLLDDVRINYSYGAEADNSDSLFMFADFDEMSRYGKAEYIESYFKNMYTYSLITDNNSGSNTMLGNFLFETRSGHCALYATAMTLALREMGIPARYVTGYVAGGGGGMSTDDGKFIYEIIERDLHAWVEVYFEGIGWLPFDPTPPIYEYNFIEAERTAGTEGTLATTTPATTIPQSATTTAVTTTPPPVTTPSETTPPNMTSPAQTTAMTAPEPHTQARSVLPVQILMFAVTAVLSGILIMSALMFINSVLRAEKKSLTKYAGIDDRNTAGETYRFILRLLKMEGLTGSPGETPVKFAIRVDNAIKGLGLTPVINVIQKLEFSNEELSELEYEKISVCAADLYKKIVTEKRLLKRFVRKMIAFKIIK